MSLALAKLFVLWPSDRDARDTLAREVKKHELQGLYKPREKSSR